MAKFYNNEIGLYYCSICNKKIKKELIQYHKITTHTEGYISFT